MPLAETRREQPATSTSLLATPRRRLGVLALAVVVLGGLAAGTPLRPGPEPYAAAGAPGVRGAALADAALPLDDALPVRLIGFNDLHGALEPPRGSGGRVRTDDGSVAAGGAAHLATHVRRLRGEVGRSVVLSAGDSIGGSPLASALLHDEPTLAVLEELGVEASALGNHELDRGYAELQRLQHGGCHPVDGCRFTPTWDGLDFPVLGANVTLEDGGAPALPATSVVRVGGVRIGVVGVTLRDLPEVSTPEAVRGLVFGDEVAAADAASRELTRQGVRAQVLLLHQGDRTRGRGRPDRCDVPPGGVAGRIAEAVSPEIDVVMTGHTHQQYVCSVTDPAGVARPVVQGLSSGRLLSVVDVRVDPDTGDVLRDRPESAPRARNVVVTRDVVPDARVARLVERAVSLTAGAAGTPVARLAAPLSRTTGPAGESDLGAVVADAQLAATGSAGAQVALVNPAGLRADLPDDRVTHADVFAAQPFGHRLHTPTLTGAQLRRTLEQQFHRGPDGEVEDDVLGVSAGLTYTWSRGGAVGAKVADVRLRGDPVADDTRLRVTVNAFLAAGGDGFTALRGGTDPTVGQGDLEALAAYLAHGPQAPTAARVSVRR